eukprot:COSAG01_NODE_619_length_14786_cov_73.363110_2_plen_121_part_00
MAATCDTSCDNHFGCTHPGQLGNTRHCCEFVTQVSGRQLDLSSFTGYVHSEPVPSVLAHLQPLRLHFREFPKFARCNAAMSAAIIQGFIPLAPYEEKDDKGRTRDHTHREQPSAPKGEGE